MLTHADMLRLKRWNTPTIYNGWEQITRHDITTCFNREETRDFMPHMGPMAGRAVTVTIQPSAREPSLRRDAWLEYRRYVASVPGPKIVVVQDLDKPNTIGAFWGEVNSNCHKALGCVGSIIDGALRDLDEMNNAGFKCLARRMCVGHAWSTPIAWNEPVEVFGCVVRPGQLLHADKHGFLAVPPEDEDGLCEAALFMDQNECDTVIAAARSAAGHDLNAIIDHLGEAGAMFGQNARARFGRAGEW